MDDFFIWVVLLLVLWAVIARRRRRRSSQSEASESERLTLTYHRIEATALAMLIPWHRRLLPEGSWTPLVLEDVPHDRRRRLVLSIAFDAARVSLERLEEMLWSLAGELQERAAAHAVMVEAFMRDQREPGDALRAGDGTLRLLLAPDGRGWSGDEVVIAAIEGDDVAPKRFSLGEVHRRLAATLDEAASDD